MALYLFAPDLLRALHPSSKSYPGEASSGDKLSKQLQGLENPTVLPIDLLRRFKHTFLIRTPQKSVPSYYKCVEEKMMGYSYFDPAEVSRLPFLHAKRLATQTQRTCRWATPRSRSSTTGCQTQNRASTRLPKTNWPPILDKSSLRPSLSLWLMPLSCCPTPSTRSRATAPPSACLLILRCSAGRVGRSRNLQNGVPSTQLQKTAPVSRRKPPSATRLPRRAKERRPPRHRRVARRIRPSRAEVARGSSAKRSSTQSLQLWTRTITSTPGEQFTLLLPMVRSKTPRGPFVLILAFPIFLVKPNSWDPWRDGGLLTALHFLHRIK